MLLFLPPTPHIEQTITITKGPQCKEDFGFSSFYSFDFMFYTPALCLDYYFNLISMNVIDQSVKPGCKTFSYSDFGSFSL